MSDDIDERAKLTAEYLDKMRPLLDQAIANILQRTSGPNKEVVVASWVQMCVDAAFRLATAGGMGPGDFIDALRALTSFYEDNYGTTRLGRIEVDLRSESEISALPTPPTTTKLN